MNTPTKSLIAFALFLGLQACGADPATMMGEPDAGTGGAVATGGNTGTGGQMMATGGAGGSQNGTGGQQATGGAPGTGGRPVTGGSTGTGGTGTGGSHATGGLTGTGGMAAPGDAGGTAGVGPYGPMPRNTCGDWQAYYADGNANVTSVVATDPTNDTCVGTAGLFNGKTVTYDLCMGLITGKTATLVSMTVASVWSGDDGTCDVTVTNTMIWPSNNCSLTVTMELFAQAPPQATPTNKGPFPAPTCN